MLKDLLKKSFSGILIICITAIFSSFVYSTIMENEQQKCWDTFTETGQMISSKLSILMEHNINTKN